MINEAAEAVGVDKNSLSSIIERLLQKGLVVREDGIIRRCNNRTMVNSARSDC